MVDLTNNAAALWVDASAVLKGNLRTWGSEIEQSLIHYFANTAAAQAGTELGNVDLIAVNQSGEVLLYFKDPAGTDIVALDGTKWTRASLNQADLTALSVALTSALSAEEGVFTPTLAFATPGDQSVAYGATRRGTYQRIGNRVTFEINMNTVTPTFTTASGRLRIGGLPYAASATIEGGALVRVIPSFISVSSGSDLFNIAGFIGSATSYIELIRQTGSAGAVQFVQASNCLTGVAGQVSLQGSYFV